MVQWECCPSGRSQGLLPPPSDPVHICHCQRMETKCGLHYLWVDACYLSGYNRSWLSKANFCCLSGCCSQWYSSLWCSPLLLLLLQTWVYHFRFNQTQEAFWTHASSSYFDPSRIVPSSTAHSSPLPPSSSSAIPPGSSTVPQSSPLFSPDFSIYGSLTFLILSIPAKLCPSYFWPSTLPLFTMNWARFLTSWIPYR